MSDPHIFLLRALMELAEGVGYLEGRTWDWSSATFAGHRHLFRLAAGPAARARLAAGIAAGGFVLPGHFVREIAIVGEDPEAVEVEALTIADA